jgi:hypothetical protein
VATAVVVVVVVLVVVVVMVVSAWARERASACMQNEVAHSPSG